MTWIAKAVKVSPTRAQARAARVALGISDPVRRELLAAVAKLRRSISASKLAAAVTAGGFADVIEITGAAGLGMIAALAARPGIADGLREGARLVAAQFDGVALDMGRAKIFRWLNDRTGKLVNQINETSLGAVRETLARGIAAGKAPRVLASEIKGMIGLTEPQAVALAGRRQALIDDGVPAAEVERRASRYADRLLRHRAEVIARNESMTAVSRGRYELWQQLVDDGALESDQKRKWVTAQDERVCPICGPLDGQATTLDGQYTLPDGSTVDSPPAHVSCRCTDVLE